MKKPFLLLLAFLLAGCASTRIVSQDSNAEIYLDDRPIGVGEATVGRIGPPRTALVEAKRDGKTVGRAEMRRSFTGMTLVWGLVSYYTGLYWGWYYPESVVIAVQSASTGTGTVESRSPWSDPGTSIWMRPLK